MEINLIFIFFLVPLLILQSCSFEPEWIACAFLMTTCGESYTQKANSEEIKLTVHMLKRGLTFSIREKVVSHLTTCYVFLIEAKKAHFSVLQHFIFIIRSFW